MGPMSARWIYPAAIAAARNAIYDGSRASLGSFLAHFSRDFFTDGAIRPALSLRGVSPMRRVCLLSCLLVALASFSVASAQSKPAADPAGPKANSMMTKKVAEKKRAIGIVDSAPATGGGPLSPEQMEKMLKDMGYEPKVIPYSDNTGKYFEIEEGGWALSVDRSGDGSNIWLSAGLAKVNNPAGPHAEKLLALLAANNTTSGTFIYYPSSQIIGIQRHVPNNNVTAGQLRKAAIGLATMMSQNVENWKGDNFK
jgi:hypothetical protein